MANEMHLFRVITRLRHRRNISKTFQVCIVGQIHVLKRFKRKASQNTMNSFRTFIENGGNEEKEH